jgi:hypothetical protein
MRVLFSSLFIIAHRPIKVNRFLKLFSKILIYKTKALKISFFLVFSRVFELAIFKEIFEFFSQCAQNCRKRQKYLTDLRLGDIIAIALKSPKERGRENEDIQIGVRNRRR